MWYKKFLIILFIIFFIFLNGCILKESSEEYLDITGKFIGEKPPGNNPKLFAKGIV